MTTCVNRRWLAACMVLVAAALMSSGTAQAGAVLEDFNALLNPGPFYWAAPTGNIGWYWTPSTDMELDGVQTKLATGLSNLDNDFTFTTTLYTDRPAAGGTVLGSFTWNGATPVDGPWLGGTFANSVALTGGQTYFLGMSGWEQGLAQFGGTGGSGVNWIHPPNQPGAETLGAGSGYTGVDFAIQMNAGSEPVNVDSPILRFIGQPIPEPGTLALFGLGVLGFAHKRRRRC